MMGCLGNVLVKTSPYIVFDAVSKKPKHRAYDAYCFGNISRSKKEPGNISATNATSISFTIIE